MPIVYRTKLASAKKLLLDKYHYRPSYTATIQSLKEKRSQLKDITLSQLRKIKEEKVSPYYNHTSMAMIAVGGIGMSLTLKYQHLFRNYLPDFMIVEQPYPNDQEKLLIGRQSLYYYSQSMYFQALSAWSIVFLRRSRMVSPIYYIMISMGFLTGTYLTDYYTHPKTKHALWFLFNLTFGAILGSYFHQQGFNFLVDALYLVGNSMTFYAASTYYNEDSSNQGIVLTAMLCQVFGILYGLGVLRLFRWGLDLGNRNVYMTAFVTLAIIMSWSIYRQKAVQDEYDMTDYNPIHASLSYSWRQIPQVIVFVEAFQHNHNREQIRSHRYKMQHTGVYNVVLVKWQCMQFEEQQRALHRAIREQIIKK